MVTRKRQSSDSRKDVTAPRNVEGAVPASSGKRSGRQSKANSSTQKLPEVAKEEIVAREHLVGNDEKKPKRALRKKGTSADGDPHQNTASNGEGPGAQNSPTRPGPGEIARRAFEIWQECGCPEGRELEHWLQAEAELIVD